MSASGLKLQQDFCLSTSVGDYSEFPQIAQNTDTLFCEFADLAVFLSKQELLMANATGTIQLIHKLVAKGAANAGSDTRLFLTYTIGIQKYISLVKSEVDAVYAELQCESFRTGQLSDYLGNLNAKRNLRLTIGAIVVGSLTTILPVLLTGKIATYAIAVSGGFISAALGAATLTNSRYTLQMATDRNLLENIWCGSNNTQLYPPQLWYYLNEPAFGNDKHQSIAQILKMRWLKFDLNNSIDMLNTKLFFGNGGVFNQDKLDMRARMLTELAVCVNSMNQYLDNLNHKINIIKLQVLQAADIYTLRGITTDLTQ